MKLYISDLSLLVLAIFYLPLVIWVLWRVVRSPKLAGLKKVFAVLVVLILAYAIPLGDVTLNSIAMTKVCPKAGLHIYKKVQVEGYFDQGASENTLLNHPYHYAYRFVETKRPGTKVIRYERQSDGSIKKTELDQPTAEYEVVYEGWQPDKTARVSRLRDLVRNRVTGEIIAERLLFNPFHGWVDRYLLNRWFGATLHGCHGPAAGTPIAYEALPPK